MASLVIGFRTQSQVGALYCWSADNLLRRVRFTSPHLRSLRCSTTQLLGFLKEQLEKSVAHNSQLLRWARHSRSDCPGEAGEKLQLGVGRLHQNHSPRRNMRRAAKRRRRDQTRAHNGKSADGLCQSRFGGHLQTLEPGTLWLPNCTESPSWPSQSSIWRWVKLG